VNGGLSSHHEHKNTARNSGPVVLGIPAAYQRAGDRGHGPTATATVVETIAMTTLQKTIIGATLAAAVGAGIYEARQAATFRTQVQLLQQQQALLAEQIQQLQQERDNAVKRLAAASAKRTLQLPTPPKQLTAPPVAPIEDLPSTNLSSLVEAGVQLTAKQVESYLNVNRRNAASLLAAYRTTRDPALLAEAMQKYPNDPHVAFESVFKEGASPEERRQWLNAFKQSAPQNALANYLSAFDYFKAGQPDQAVEELITASGKPQFQDYSLNRIQDDEEAYLAAGYPVAEAKTLSSMQLAIPQLAQLKELGRNMMDLATAYQNAGDQTSAQNALQIAADLGLRYGNPSAGEGAIFHLVGMRIERTALSAMDPNSLYGSSGQTVQDRLNQLAQQKTRCNDLLSVGSPLMQTMSDQDWIIYTDRFNRFGEWAAQQWLVNKYGQK
jgi:hypothetical protein